MSGTSLDGIDLAWCDFEEVAGGWNYRIRKATTIPYDAKLKQRLANATELSAYEYAKLDVELGTLFAHHISKWIVNEAKPEFIASHGHTIFHQPQIGLTTQIGSGAVLAAHTGITTVCDFRTTDVALQGQGAPLVPIGDEILFGNYDACLNLGGFANISFRQNNKRIAFDISPCNMAINWLASLLGMNYDKNGEMASSGNCVPQLVDQLNTLPYFQKEPPKSLGKEWFELNMKPILEKAVSLYGVQNCLKSVCTHIAMQIGYSIPKTAQTMLITGGGAHNNFLIQLIKKHCHAHITVPDTLTIDYKEAVVFAFLGLLRLQQRENCLKTVTGASKNSCVGAVYIS